MTGPIPLVLCGVLGLGALATLAIARARITAAVDTRRAFLALDTAARRAERAPDGRPLDTSEIRARVLADTWFREDRLSVAGYGALCDALYAGLDVYPYWSGGELHGTAVVWDGTRGRAGERVTVEEWNADAEREAAQLDTDLAPAPMDDLDAHLCPTCGRRLAYHVDAGEYCASCAPASFLRQLDALDAERQHRNGGAA